MASENSWCLLENEMGNQQVESYSRDSDKADIHCSVSQCLLLAPFLLLKSPLTAHPPPAGERSVSGSFSFAVFLISASKKPLPPTPEDNRVSEHSIRGAGGPTVP